MTGPEIAIIALAAAGTGTAAYGQYQQGKQAQAQAKAESAWNLYNSKVAQREAESERAAGAAEAAQHRKRTKAILARLSVGGRGVEMEGSPLLFKEDAAAELMKDEMNIRLNSQNRASKFKSQSILDISKASAANSRASGFGKAAVVGAGSAILAGGSGAVGKANKFGWFDEK